VSIFPSAYDISGAVQATSTDPTPVKRAFATAATSATHQLVAGVTGKKIRVLAFFATTVDGLNLAFRSGSTQISGNIAATGIVSAYCPHGWFETDTGAALNFSIDANESTSVHVVYIEV
jgi:hypothetical protein